MIKFLVILFVVIVVVSAKSAYPTETYSTYEKPVEYKAHPYSFEWGVKDEFYNDYTHSENSDGKVITGSYRIELPDGRAQIVTYKADSSGYTADVNYEGEAQYPPVDYQTDTYPAYPVRY